MFICLRSAGKKEATAGRQGHGGRRGPGRLKILPQPWCPWKRSFFLERGLRTAGSPPVRVDIICQAGAEGWGQMVSPPRCVGLGPIAQGDHGVRPSLGGWVGDSPGSTRKVWGSQNVFPLGMYHLQSSVLWVGGLAASGLPPGGVWVPSVPHFLAKLAWASGALC